MTDRTWTLVGTVAGAFAGAITVYLVVTSRGRYLAAQVNPTIDDLLNGVQEFRRAVRKAHDLAHEVRGAAKDVHATLDDPGLSTDL